MGGGVPTSKKRKVCAIVSEWVDNRDKRDGSVWQAETPGTTVGEDAADMSRYAAYMQVGGDKKKGRRWCLKQRVSVAAETCDNECSDGIDAGVQGRAYWWETLTMSHSEER